MRALRRFLLRLIPVYAGSTATCEVRSRTRSAHPRLRGEHSEIHDQTGLTTGSSPSTRGAPPPLGLLYPLYRLIPVYAGSTANVALKKPQMTAHPRLRGEHHMLYSPLSVPSGSSPSTRGALGRPGRLRNHLRLIPVYAGSTTCTWTTSAATSAHPRLRGEHELAGAISIIHPGSSPSTRGALRAGHIPGGPGRLIPVYAGSTGHQPPGLGARPAHPRLRGEHRVCRRNTRCFAGSSPSTRGAPQVIRIGKEESRLIPVYAGSTALRPMSASLRSAHPRLRGEHANLTAQLCHFFGSSPSTRGAHPRCFHRIP